MTGAFARDPGVFRDLPGQDAVVAQLRRAAAGAAAQLAGQRPEPGAMTHAWLFTGPPGSGRSVAARAFAASLLCGADASATPAVDAASATAAARSSPAPTPTCC